MSSANARHIGINDARPILGDLVTAVEQGAEIVLTRRGRPAARIVAFKETAMTVTTATTYGAEFGEQEQMDGILAYINGGEYTDEQQDKLSDALFAAHRTEVDEMLPEGVSWQPATSEFLHPVGVDVPERDDMREIFEAAWRAVEARYDAIEAEALA